MESLTSDDLQKSQSTSTSAGIPIKSQTSVTPTKSQSTSGTPTKSQSTLRTPRRTRSILWKWFEATGNGNQVKCLLCNKTVERKSETTTYLEQHLEKEHKKSDEFNQFSEERKAEKQKRETIRSGRLILETSTEMLEKDAEIAKLKEEIAKLKKRLHDKCGDDCDEAEPAHKISRIDPSNIYDEVISAQKIIQSVIDEGRPGKNVFIGFSGGLMPAFLAPLLIEIKVKKFPQLFLFPVDQKFDSDGNSSAKLLSFLPDDFPVKQIINIPNESPESIDAANEFESKLRQLEPTMDGRGLPIFDLLLLGLDPNGHISSEFPADALLKQQDNVWFALCGESPKRVAITLGVLNAAKTVAIIGTKQEKAKAVGSILDNGLISQIHEVAWCTIDQSEYQKLEEKAKN